ncbi:MAG: sulfatase [Bacteroidota bacterium]|nr:sulfatase [Bacteroidota bacterium]
MRIVLPLILCCAGSVAARPQPDYGALSLPERPNILWIVAEDMSATIPAFGDSTIETPNLDRLAREGIRYTHMFSVSGVCAPSRFAIATGVYPTRGGALHMRTSSRPEYMEQIGVVPYEAVPDPEVRMMSEVLRMHGYYTSNNSKQDYQFTAPVTAWDANSRQAHWRNRPDNTPFFAVFNFGITHESQIWSRAQDSLWVDADLDVPVPPYLPNTEPVRTDIRRMYSNIRILDHRIGQLLTALGSDGLLDETVIFFYSDHGGPLPRQKRQLYDSGLHVPLMVRFPHAQQGGRIDAQLVSFVDLAPTVFSLAGIALPSFLDGQAFLGAQRSDAPRSYIHAAADRFDTEYDTKRAVRDDRYKYIRNFRPERGYYLAVTYREQMATMQELLRLRDAGELDQIQSQWFRPSKPVEELFDTYSDPHEIHSLADRPEHAERLRQMRQELNSWMASTGDPGTMPEKDYVATLWPNHIQPQTTEVSMQMTGEHISLTSATNGASIGYQWVESGAVAGDAWQVFSGPIMRMPGKQLVAIAHRIGYKPSAATPFSP